MKKLLLGIAALAIAATWILLPQTPACAAGNCKPGGSTIPQWGMGATCAEADDDAIDNAWTLVPSSCAVCGFEEDELSPCHDCPEDEGLKCADWRIIYRCEEEFGDPPM